MMKAAFTLAARYHVRAECLTPLRTGDANADPESVLWDSEGRALVQGSSIAGALRGWLEARDGESSETVLALFGSASSSASKRSGRLIVSDGRFPKGTRAVIRPRLRIDGKTGSAADGAKFDVAHIPTGSAFEFTLTWLGDADSRDELRTVKDMLSALHGGAICLGAQKTNGFGQVRLDASERLYDMSDGADRDAWLEGRDDGATPLKLSDSAPGQYVTFRLRGRADNLLVKGASIRFDEDSEKSRSYTAHLRENETPVLPGSSVKGAVRAHAERITRYLNAGESLTRELFGYAAEGDAEGTPGKVIFEDMLFHDAKPDRTIARIRINRFTAGVIRGGLFSEEAVSGAAELRVRVPADCGAGCALILYALRDLAAGLYSLGSGGAIGRGRLSKPSLSAETPDGKKLELVFDGDGARSVSDPDGLWPVWREAWEAHCL